MFGLVVFLLFLFFLSIVILQKCRLMGVPFCVSSCSSERTTERGFPVPNYNDNDSVVPVVVFDCFEFVNSCRFFVVFGSFS